MFTFLTISYNQEKYIIEHLESIKYQIKKYANGRDMCYILADDGSSDRTVELAKRWLELNGSLFKDINILDYSQNNGTVYNYIRAINSVTTSKYKCLAADDLYYKNNIFDLGDEADIVLSPALFFSDDGRLLAGKNLFYYTCAGKKDDSLKKEIKRELSYYCGIHAPGSFVNPRIIQDAELQKYLSQFKWIEDYPQWYYIFNKYDKDFSVSIEDKIYILYRADVGISSKKGVRNPMFIEEDNRIKQMIGNKRIRYKKYLNVYRYWYTLKRKYIECIKVNTNQIAKEIKCNYSQAQREAGEYMQYLKNNSFKN